MARGPSGVYNKSVESDEPFRHVRTEKDNDMNMEIYAQPSGSDKIFTILCHLSLYIGLPFLLPFVVFLAMRNESRYVADNAREALNFHISLLIYGICCIPLMFILIGIPCLILLGLVAFIFAVVAAIKAADGSCYHYPLTLRLV